MRWSQLFAPTLREAPGDAEAASHKLLVRGGFIRQLHAGHYSMLPLGWKVHQKVAQVVRDEINAIGGQEFLLPTMHPASIWQASGRWDTMGEIMFRLEDRRGNATALGITHEEIFATVASELNSYKQLPQVWYHIQTKFRDEARAKAGLLRVREFHMKDSYSFDVDAAGLDVAFDNHDRAYRRIFERLGIPAFGVEASSGAMGGTDSVEFMTPSPAGEDDVARCPSCDYAANIEKATSALPPIEAGETAELEKFPTPGVRTIAALEEFDGGAPAIDQLKTLVMVLDGTTTLVVVRGDHQLNLQKLIDATGAIEIRPANPEETVAALGANPGSLGAVAVTDHPVIVDLSLEGRVNMTTGANEDDFHYRGVSVERDLQVGQWTDLREVSAGEACPRCGTPLEIVRCIEIGHIFKLGTGFSETFGATISSQEGDIVPIVMGSYGIGIGRNMAAVAETHHDDKGLVWPVSVAPFEAVITVMKIDDEATMNAAELLYDDLRHAGVDVVLDDRDARAGVKFADSELVGIPFRLTVGPRGLKDGNVEYTVRSTMETVDVPLESAATTVIHAVHAAKAVPHGGIGV
ncbi:MAG: proline--tRNA ligase [Acidimicrobiales bacterium]|nr:proline--tRNA ligase [Acidimicrobiales bacterium]RZV45710.1 MAG: proline--tRNA ligase [Acidimicrobiales bacterium]